MLRHYPELETWFKEGLFTRSNLGGYNFSIAQKQRFITKIRTAYFESPRGENVGASRAENAPPALEMLGFRRARIRGAFEYITDREMRQVLEAMILDTRPIMPLPSARDVAWSIGKRWPQFVSDFNYALWQMYDAGVMV